MEKNVAGKWAVFAYGSPTHATLAGKPITGDAANITANIYIDGGVANAVDDVNPSELEGGLYNFDITAAESNGDQLVLAPVSSTTNVIVIAISGAVYTRPANFNALGIAADGDISGNVDGTVAAVVDKLGFSLAPDQSAVTFGTVNLMAGVIGTLDALDTAQDSQHTATKAVVDSIQLETTELQTDWVDGGRLDLILDAVNAKTGQLTFTVAGQVDSNAQSMNDTTVLGTGTALDLWRG